MNDAPLFDSAPDLLPPTNGNLTGNGHVSAEPEPTPPAPVALDYSQEQESDARHEPLPPTKPPAQTDNASTIPQLASPPDPESIPIDPPHGTPPPPEGELLEDVRMAEEPTEPLEPAPMPAVQLQVEREPSPLQPPPAPVNGSTEDVKMDDTSSPIDFPPTSNPSTSHTTPNDYFPPNEDDQDEPHPTKRARKYSDADQASLAHSATPPPASMESVQANGGSEDAIMATPVPTPTATALPHAPEVTHAAPAAPLDSQQYRFGLSILRSLKKMKDAAPFLRPVDPVASNVPHYFNIITNPMDISTVERKMGASNPTKRDRNPGVPHYDHIEEFVQDVRYIFSNCLTFNGPEHVFTGMSRNLENAFEKQLANMPIPSQPKLAAVKKIATPTPPPAVIPAKKPPPRRPSTSVPVIRRSDNESVGRPKREIHPPPPKDLPYADVPKKHRKVKRPKDEGTVEQLRFCGKVLEHLTRKQYVAIASPFYEPVDWLLMDIPSYPKIVKRPMDLSTMRKKLDAGDYPSAERFREDFKLMIRNCFLFNPPSTPVNQAGMDLQRIFDDKWKGLPVVREGSDDDDDDEEDPETDEDSRQREIARIENQIEEMRGSLDALKSTTPKPVVKPKKKEKPPPREKAPVASASRPVPKQPKASTSASTSSKKKTTKKPIADDDTLTFEQKKDLSESISKLDEAKLEKVINIIHEGVPEIRESTEEIELEIDLLPASVLTKLYNFVIRPQRAPATKRVRPGRGGTGTGGLKRKSMDEDAEAEKIRQLEERMALFDNGGANGGAPLGKINESSDSSSGSDSSGSDSE